MLQKKKLLSFFSAIALATTLLNVKPISSTTTKLSFDPPIVYAAPGESLFVNITISDAELIYSWQVNMSFDPTILEFVNVTEGDFLKLQPQGSARAGLRVEERWAAFAWSSIGEVVGVSGDGVLATVEFQVLGVGESILGFGNRTSLIKQLSPVPPARFEDAVFTAVDGFFINTLTPPVADFTYSPKIPGINKTITFDASASSAASGLEIVEYFWDFGDRTNVTVTTPTVNHTYTTGGVFTISLTVFDNATVPEDSLVRSIFNTTGEMPRIWYELYSTKTITLGITFVHDIAVTEVVPSKREVTAGETVSINITVLNKGTEPEDFTVTAYYDTHEIESKPVDGLNPGEEKTLIFNWHTTDVAEGDYLIKAEALEVEGEGNLADNTYIDGTVTVKAGSGPFPTTLTIIGGAMGVVAVLVAIALLFRRRKSVPST